MSLSGDKKQFVGNLQTADNLLLQAKGLCADVVNFYFKNGFQAGGSNPISDADVAASGLTAARVAAGITLMQQLANFFGNQPVTQGDYEATVQQVRTN